MKMCEVVRVGAVAALATATALGASACGDDSTGPEGPGMVDVTMYDSSGTASAVAPMRATQAQDSYSGTFQGQVGVEISTDGSTWVDVSPPASATVELQSNEQTALAGDVEVEAGSYSRIRITMSGVTTQLEAGAVVGGITYTSAVTVAIGGGSEVVVEKEIFPFTVNGESHIVVLVDLNSETWITSETVEAGAVAASQVQAATSVEARRK